MVFKKGHIPWSKGKKLPQMSGKNNSFYGKHHTKETRRKISLAHKGKKLSIETIEKMRKSHLGNYQSEETREKIGRAHKGRKHSEEQIKKHSETLKRLYKDGKIINFMKGKHHTEETKRKISQNKERARKISVALKGKYKGKNASMYGKKLSEEHKEKIRQKAIGRGHTKETKRKISKINKGKKHPFLSKLNKLKIGSKNPAWLGGISFEPYGLEFNKQLKVVCA